MNETLITKKSASKEVILVSSLFRVFGNGVLGAKVDDLIRFEPLLKEKGLEVLGGDVVAMDIYKKLLQQYSADICSDENMLKAKICPDCLRQINGEILSGRPENAVLAVRSSAAGDSAGRGIYATKFMVLGPDEDSNLDRLWRCQAEVYASCLSPNAKIWQEKTGNKPEMAILVQEVPGIWLDGSYLPQLSGTAYSSFEGLPLLQVVKGFGARAVRGDGIGFNTVPDEVSFSRMLWEQQEADALTRNGIEAEAPTNYREMDPAGAAPALKKLLENLVILKGIIGDLYIEWVWRGGEICILQCAQYHDELPDESELDPDQFFLLASSKDVQGRGRATFRAVALVNSWSAESALLLAKLNEELSDYLLVVPEKALSDLANYQKDGQGRIVGNIQLEHFSNASCLFESQTNWKPDQIELMKEMQIRRPKHLDGSKGASHFRRVCQDFSVLYVGGCLDAQKILDLPGVIDYRGHIKVWLVDGIVNIKKGQGSIYLSKRPVVRKHQLSELERWSYGLRDVANHLEKTQQDLANSFYMVHYAIAPESIIASIDYDPFLVDPEIVRDCGGLVGFRKDLQAVLDQGSLMVDEREWEGGLETYLRELDERVGESLMKE